MCLEVKMWRNCLFIPLFEPDTTSFICGYTGRPVTGYKSCRHKITYIDFIICLECFIFALNSEKLKYLKKILSLLIWERQRPCEWGRGRERETENPYQAPHCQCRAQCGARTHETVRCWLEPKPRVRCLTDWATQVPPSLNFLAIHLFRTQVLSRVLNCHHKCLTHKCLA